MKSNFNGIWNKFRKFSPPVVRLLACDRVKGYAYLLTDEQIAERCELSVSQIQQIYWTKTWDQIALGDVREFFIGCGYDLDKSASVKMLTSKFNPSFRWNHLKKSPQHKLCEQLLKFALDK